MTISHLFAGIPTRDLDTALRWYERLLSRAPDRFPNEREAVWQLTENGLIYVVADPLRAGNGLITLIVDDLERWMTDVAARGIPVGEVETLGSGVRRITLADPDGNTISIGQVTPGPGRG
jgi:catechol 2,3-dioxygenase-like lactoylglutathione lyase family enzyme